MKASKSNTVYAIAQILSGEKEEAVIPNIITENARNRINFILKTNGQGIMSASPNLKLSKNYVLHMDNSGHLTGQGYGKKGHKDTRPLTILQISRIPAIINQVSRNQIVFAGVKHGLPRIVFLSKTDSQMVLTEISNNKKFLTIATSYNLSKPSHNKLMKQIQKQNATFRQHFDT